MTQRFTLDRQSFEQFLAAASLLQQFQRHASRTEADVQPFWALVDLQRAVHSGTANLDSVVQQVPELAEQLVGADGAGVWLFTNDDEFTWRAGTARYAGDERLRMEVLSRLAAMEEEPSDWRAANRNWDAGYYPGCVKSLLVAPIQQDSNVAGAVAAFATEFDAFTDRDGSKLRLLAGVLGQALDSAAKAGYQPVAALERAALRELLERMIPHVQGSADGQSGERHRSNRLQGMGAQNAMQDDPLSPTEVVDPAWSDSAVRDQAFTSPPAKFSGDTSISDEQVDEESRVASIYVPGVGVRAALGYDDEKEPSQFWSHLRNGIVRGLSLTSGAVGGSFRAVGRAGSYAGRSLVRLTSGAGALVHDAVQHRPKLPPIPTDGIRTSLARTRATCRAAASRARGKVRAAAKQITVPELPKDSIQQGFSSAEAWTGNSLRKVGRALRDAPNVIPDVPPVPFDRLRQSLGRAAQSISGAVRRGVTNLRPQIARWRPAPPAEIKINWRVARRTMPAAAVLLIMVAFLLSQPGLHKTVEVASASTRVSVPPATAVLPTAKLGAPSTPSPHTTDLSTAPTHRNITDPGTQSDLENMTRYEIATARRAAQYGDDVSAFELGMAYEIGYDVSPNCAKAAEWVRRAAEQGNAAAEYNLGLRYRDGDGVTPDAQQAANWLQKAAAQKYANANQVLASLNTR